MARAALIVPDRRQASRRDAQPSAEKETGRHSLPLAFLFKSLNTDTSGHHQLLRKTGEICQKIIEKKNTGEGEGGISLASCREAEHGKVYRVSLFWREVKKQDQEMFH